VLNGYHPYLDESVGSNVDDYISAMDHMESTYQIETVIPGHGEMGGAELITIFHQYFDDLKMASEDIDLTEAMRKKYGLYRNIPVNKAGFDQTIQFIRSNLSVRN
jgi:hypothetical protein